ncbi:tetratricopeptide repeat protein [Aquabacterium sp. A7-Y]|uniref:tetratricopeptide repeat protein n=1 Tax=Aquabacterium sp. A7-Y TaxID=1349605 RepID=UPI00223E0B52|nr:tetratricopeptide repeat protein [Aquabacterium sp. A7-Y]MCW7540861.1 tetratricopeptide repeat protein [Aquabacterium sp. A7-Y]
MQPSETALLATLDADELFMLGVRASTSNDPAAALAYLKQAVVKAPEHARAHWLLGAEYASLGMVDRARAGFERAVELDPDLHLARFQLGLLRLTSGDVEAAQDTWGPLDVLPEADPVRLFRDGLLHMVRDEFPQALEAVRQALATPGLDAALKRDMEMVLGRIEAAHEHRPGGAGPEAGTPLQPAEPEAPAESHLVLSAYQRGFPSSSH